ncbi:MAG: hypothetical protein J6B98_04295 [Bacilli bacterium]|nr:hypothetical protein [Bacilli bacterium]
MYYLDFEDFIVILFKSIIFSIIITALIIGGMYLIDVNFNFANYICNVTQIPYNLTLSVAGAGFGNDIFILMTVAEAGILGYLVYEVMQTRIYKTIYKFVVNL